MRRNIATLLLCVILSACSSMSREESTTDRRPIPVYGCWCGPHQPALDENPQPIDEWDEACRNHDLCYREYGRNNPDCDREFLGELDYIIQYRCYTVGDCRAPGQMQAAYGIFYSRLTPGWFGTQGYFNLGDLVQLFDAGENCEE